MKTLALLFFSISIAIPASAATFTVNNTSDAVDARPGDGVCETGSGNGICTLRAAIQEAGATTNANTIVIPAGTYLLSQTPACSFQLVTNHNILTENTSSLCVKGNVTITGAGTAVTIIDAGAQVAPTCCGSYPNARGMLIDLNATVQLSGVTIQHGWSNGGFLAWGGGAINNQGHLTVTDCVLTANNGVPGGGGIWNDNVVSVQDSTITGNNATGYGGGGIYNEAGTATISNTTISFNTSGNGGGGAVFQSPGAISNSIINNNTSTANGGGIYAAANLTLTNVTLSGNHGFTGGAMNIPGAITVTGNNLTITGNHADNRTGGVEFGGTFVLGNSVLWGNYTEPNPASITDCNGTIHSTGHNLIGESDSTCVLTGSNSDKTGVNPLLGALGNNGGPTQTHPLLAGSLAIDSGDPGTPGSGGTACAATDQRGFLRPFGARCDVGAFESSSAMLVSSVTPKHAGNIGPAALTIGGNGFVSGLTAKLQHPGQPDIVGAQIFVLAGSSSLTATFDLTNAQADNWDVMVTNPDNTSSTLPGGFTIDTGGAPDVFTQLVGPPSVRAGYSATFYLVYGNRGNAEALAVPVSIHTPGPFPMAISYPLTTPPAQSGQIQVDWSTMPLYATPGPEQGVLNVPLLIPVIPPGFTGILPFKITISSGLQEGTTFQLAGEAGQPFANPQIDPNILSQTTAGAIEYANANLGVTVSASNAAQIENYISNQIDNVITAGRAAYVASGGGAPQIYSLPQLLLDGAEFAAFGTSTGFAKPVGHAVTLGAFGQKNGCAVGNVMVAGSTCGTSGDNNVMPPDLGPDKGKTPMECSEIGGHRLSNDRKSCIPTDKSCLTIGGDLTGGGGCTTYPILGSVDPNLKSGPGGTGAQHYLPGAQPLDYLVEFENQATATAPAQTVVVTDQLDTATLDLSTFSFGPVAFGQYLLTPSPGLQHFTTGIDLRPDVNLAVKIDGNLNLANGVVTWKFVSLDPTTLQPTADPTAGFLPPDVTPPQGLATLLYSISPKSPLASGTTICNQAVVVFDVNAPILTQNFCNTIDSIAPSSQVAPLPVNEAATNFTVQWSGADAGSGILDFTIFASDNGGAFTLWLANTTLTQSTFSGVSGHTFGFYSIARDQALNVEGVKSSAETLTTVGPAQVTLQSIAVTPANPSIVKGGTQQFTATGTYSDSSTQNITGTVTWTSATMATATITAGGLASGVGVGTSTITATLGPVSGSTVLTVTAASLQSIAVTPANPSIVKGGTQQFTATGTYSDSSTQNITGTVTWTSATMATATITAGGLASGVGVGTSTITATLGPVSGSTVLTVTAASLQSIAVTPANPSIVKGGTQQFTATGTYSDSSTQNITGTVTWTSATMATATITAGGLASGVGVGTSTITATLGPVSGSTVLTVTTATLQSISVTPANPSIVKGATQQFTATGTYSDSSTQNITGSVTWTSGTLATATIAAGGLASGVGVGTSTITATLGPVSGSTLLTVTAAVAPTITNVTATSITSNSATITWTTNQGSSSQVEYGTTGSYGSLTTLNSSLVASHSVTLTGLTAGTAYDYAVLSQNSGGTLATSGNFTFTTTGAVGGGGAITVTGNTCANWTYTNSTACTWTPSAPLVGNSIHCFVFNFSTTNGLTLTDNAGVPNTYTQNGLIYYGSANTGHYALFDDLTVTNGSLTKTIANLTGAGSFFGLSCYETTGGSEIVDGPVGTGSASSGSVSATINPSGTADLASCGISSSNNFMPGSGYKAIATEPFSPTTSMYQVLSSSGSQTASATITGGTDLICATYRSTSSGPPPDVISSVTATSITSSSATITWTTSQASSSQVEYGTTTSYGSLSTLNSSLVTSHSVTLTGLTAGTTYDYAVLSQNSGGTLATSGNFTFATTGAVGGGGAITVTGNTCANWTYTNSTACTWTPSAPAVGNSIHCFVFNFSTTNGFTLTDNAGVPNTYTQNGATYYGSANTGHYALFDNLSVTNGSLTKTIANVTGSGAFFGLSCYETAGGSEIVDGPMGTGSASSGSVSATMNPTGTADLASCGISSSNNFTPGSGYKAIATEPFSPTTSMYQILSASGSQTASATITGGTDMICATYRSSSSGPPPDVISAVTATSITSSSAIITWTTSQASTSQVAYGTTPSYGSLSTLNSSLVTAHSVTLTGLTAGTTYDYAVSSQNSGGTLATSGNFTFATTGAVGGSGAIAVTGNTCANWTYTNSTACTWTPSAPAVGNSIHCFVFNFSTTNGFTLTDNAGVPNTYTQNGAIYYGNANTGHYALFDNLSVTNGSLTKTIANVTGSGAFFGLSCYETAGGSEIVDGPVWTGSASSGSVSATINPSGTADLASCGVSSSNNFTPGGGYKTIATEPFSPTTSMYQVLSASGSQTASATITSATDMICTTYKLAH